MSRKLKQLDPIGGEHGVSSVFPTLDDVIAFKDGSMNVSRGYPRFVMHPYLEQLAERVAPGKRYRWVASSVESAQYQRDIFSPDLRIEISEQDGWALMSVDDLKFSQLYEDARNAGFTMSSRRAKRILDGVQTPQSGAAQKCAKKISELERWSSADRTYMFPSGMCAILAALEASYDSERSGAVIVGNPYVDTIQLFTKYLTRRGGGAPPVVESYDHLACAADERTGIIYLEIPTNPLVRIADIEQIAEFAQKRRITLIVDSTIASPFNINPFAYGADFVMHSTTKFLNGMNDHLGGVLMVNPKSDNRYAARVSAFIAKTNICMDDEEAQVLLKNMEGFTARMEIINRNALALARYLELHKAVGRVYYPLLQSHPDYALAQRYLPKGGSGIVSFSFAGSNLERARQFYDNCTLTGKGPSLGGEETLLCPITLLTYFRSSDDELAVMGLDRYLMRLSVGVEDIDFLISQIEAGLSAVKL